MKGFREIRKRIQAVKTIEDISSAMKTISSAKLKKWGSKFSTLSAYRKQLEEIIASIEIARNMEDVSVFFTPPVREAPPLFVIVTSNRGLCGPFNNQVIRFAIRQSDLLNNPSLIITAGRRAYKYFKPRYPEKVIDDFSHVWDRFSTQEAFAFSRKIIDLYRNGCVSSVKIIYNKFKNVMVQYPVIEEILPVKALNNGMPRDYIYEPAMKETLLALINMYVEAVISSILMESFVAEHSARVTALQKALDNARTLKHELTLEYNKARQAHITKEIIEIVSGAEALS